MHGHEASCIFETGRRRTSLRPGSNPSETVIDDTTGLSFEMFTGNWLVCRISQGHDIDSDGSLKLLFHKRGNGCDGALPLACTYSIWKVRLFTDLIVCIARFLPLKCTNTSLMNAYFSWVSRLLMLYKRAIIALCWRVYPLQEKELKSLVCLWHSAGRFFLEDPLSGTNGSIKVNFWW